MSGRIPGALIALVAATTATAALHLDSHGVAVIGRLAAGFAAPALPHLRLASLLSIVGLAAIVSLVVMVQTGAVSRSFNPEGAEPDVDGDYLGVGAGAVLAGLFGAFPVNASPPRTAAVLEAGGRSQAGGMVAAVALALLVAFGGGLLEEVPMAALAGVLLFVASRIVRWRAFVHVARRAPAEFALALATTALIIVLPIETGAAIGIFLSLAHGVFSITRARLTRFEPIPGTSIWWPAPPHAVAEAGADVIVMGFQAPLLFLNAYAFRAAMARAVAASHGAARLFVLEASNIVEIDVTAADILAEVIRTTRSAGVDVAIARLESLQAQARLERLGVMEVLGKDHLFHSVADAIAALHPAPV